MALVKNAESSTLVRDAFVLDLGDLARQAAEMKAEARAEADRLRREGEAERQRLISDAHAVGLQKGHEEGFQAGHAEGLAQGRFDALEENRQLLERMEQGWVAAINAFDERRDQLIAGARADVLRLALAIAQRVTKRAIAADPGAAVAQLEAALEHVLAPTRLVVRVHRTDAELAATALPNLTKDIAESAHVELRSDESLQPGDCVIETAGGEIDARVDVQLERIVSALLPGFDAAAPLASPAQDDPA